MPPIQDPAVLVGISSADDAAAYRIDDRRAILQTIDFITPIVDDPYAYGQIAAANSLSDVYAMGGRPLFALNMVCFPASTMPIEVLSRILQGGCDKASEAGIDIIGGHSVDDPEPKYGLSVTGIVESDQILTNAGAQPGDVLVLTKPLGSGILTTAMKQDRVPETLAKQVTDIMATLNRQAAEALEGLEVHAVTDVTGFGLLGHLVEMLLGAKVGGRIAASSIPVLEQVCLLAQEGIVPGGAQRNLGRFGPSTKWNTDVPEALRLVLADPQTSGGLLIAIAPADLDRLLDRLGDLQVPANAVIGDITDQHAGVLHIEAS